jgi:hypothetical protein
MVNVQIVRIRLGFMFETAGWFARFGVEDHSQDRDGVFIIFPPSTHVTNPGWEIGNGDKLLAQPGEIGNVTHVHNARRAFIARHGFGFVI